MAKYLDATGVATLWSKMKSYVDNKTGSNVSLSSNNTWTGTNTFNGAINLKGYTINESGNGTRKNELAIIKSDGVMEIGEYLDFHNNNEGSGNDYSTRLEASGNYKNTVNLPSADGTLALKSDIPNITDLNQVDDKIKHMHAQGNASSAVWLRIIYLGTDGGKVNINGSLGTYETYGNAHVNMTLNARSGKQVLGTVQTDNFNTAFGRVDFGIDDSGYVWIKWNGWYNYDFIITCNKDAYFVDTTTSSSAPSWIVSTGYTGTYSHLIIN